MWSIPGRATGFWLEVKPDQDGSAMPAAWDIEFPWGISPMGLTAYQIRCYNRSESAAAEHCFTTDDWLCWGGMCRPCADLECKLFQGPAHDLDDDLGGVVFTGLRNNVQLGFELVSKRGGLVTTLSAIAEDRHSTAGKMAQKPAPSRTAARLRRLRGAASFHRPSRPSRSSRSSSPYLPGVRSMQYFIDFENEWAAAHNN